MGRRHNSLYNLYAATMYTSNWFNVQCHNKYNHSDLIQTITITAQYQWLTIIYMELDGKFLRISYNVLLEMKDHNNEI